MAENQRLFMRKWVDSKIMEGYINNIQNKDKNIIVPKDSIAVYTAITNDYDTLKEQPSSARDSTKFIAFTENKQVSKTWEIKSVCKDFKDPNRNAKIHKVLSHKFLPEYEYSLWIDGSVTIRFPFSIQRLAEIYLAEHDLAIFRHPERNCLFQEANVCLKRRLDDPEIIKKQVERYTQDGFPSNNGLVEATIILRRHSPKVIEFNEAWWDEIQNGSKRDQISFNYVAEKVGLKFKYFPGSLRTENYLFKITKHNKQR
jgi:hypothetical protein